MIVSSRRPSGVRANPLIGSPLRKRRESAEPRAAAATRLHTALDLTARQQRINDGSDVVNDGVTVEHHFSGLWIDLDFAYMASVGEARHVLDIPRDSGASKHSRSSHMWYDSTATNLRTGRYQVTRGRFQPGKSGNPGGRPKDIGRVKELAQQHTEEAITALVTIMRGTTEPAAARVRAAEALLDRGWGKPEMTNHISGDDGGPLTIRWQSDFAERMVEARERADRERRGAN